MDGSTLVHEKSELCNPSSSLLLRPRARCNIIRSAPNLQKGHGMSDPEFKRIEVHVDDESELPPISARTDMNEEIDDETIERPPAEMTEEQHFPSFEPHMRDAAGQGQSSSYPHGRPFESAGGRGFPANGPRNFQPRGPFPQRPFVQQNQQVSGPERFQDRTMNRPMDRSGNSWTGPPNNSQGPRGIGRPRSPPQQVRGGQERNFNQGSMGAGNNNAGRSDFSPRDPQRPRSQPSQPQRFDDRRSDHVAGAESPRAPNLQRGPVDSRPGRGPAMATGRFDDSRGGAELKRGPIAEFQPNKRFRSTTRPAPLEQPPPPAPDFDRTPQPPQPPGFRRRSPPRN